MWREFRTDIWEEIIYQFILVSCVEAGRVTESVVLDCLRRRPTIEEYVLAQS